MTSKIPIFPLKGAIFFPDTNLPLNIFEPRYIKMVDYALSKNKEIGMIQSKNNGDLYLVGCIGKITFYEQTDDGRYIINLLGKNFFSFKNEIKSKNSFRIVDANIIKTNFDIAKYKTKKIDKKNLIDSYKKYVSKNKIDVDVNFLNKVDIFTLIKFLAMTTPFSNVDKQMLIETCDISDLYDKLIALFEYYLSQKGQKNSVN